MSNSYAGIFNQLQASFNSLSAATEARNALLQYVYSDISPEPAAPFGVINTNIYNADGTATDLGQTARVTVSDATIRPAPITLSNHPSFAMPLPMADRAKGLSSSVIDGLRDAGVKVIAKAMNQAVASLVTSTKFNVNTPLLSGVADTVPNATLAAGWEVLSEKDVPVNDLGDLFLVTTPKVYKNMLVDAAYTKADTIGQIASGIRQTALLNNQLGFYADWDNNCPTSKAIMFHRKSIAFVSRAIPTTLQGNVNTTYVFYKGIPIKVTIALDLLAGQDIIMFESLFGVDVVRPEYGVLINASVS